MEKTTATTNQGFGAVPKGTDAWRVTGPNKMELRCEALPMQLEPGMVEMQLLKCGICGSDQSYYAKGACCILGHEATARVVKVASDVTRVKVGELVAVEPARPCGKCVECEDGRYHTCRNTRYMATPPEDGCLAKLFQWPAQWCHRIPEALHSRLRVATLAEPLAACLQAIALRKRCVPYRQGHREFEAVLGGGSMAMGVIALRQAQSTENRLISAARSMADINFALKLFRHSDNAGHVVVVLETASLGALEDVYKNDANVHVYSRETIDVAAVKAQVEELGADIIVQLSSVPDAPLTEVLSDARELAIDVVSTLTGAIRNADKRNDLIGQLRTTVGKLGTLLTPGRNSKADNIKVFQLARELAGHRISAAYECTGSELILEAAIESRFLRGEGAMIGLGCHYGIQFDKASLRRDEVALMPVRRSKDKFPTVLDLIAKHADLFELLVGSTLTFEETPKMNEKRAGTPTGTGGPKVLIEVE
jgi:threonine dehydrogenase-like Zn-dependent dehydrogenase